MLVSYFTNLVSMETWRQKRTIPPARKARLARPSIAHEIIPSREETKRLAAPTSEATIPRPPVNAAYPVTAGADPIDCPLAKVTESPRTMTAKMSCWDKC